MSDNSTGAAERRIQQYIANYHKTFMVPLAAYAKGLELRIAALEPKPEPEQPEGDDVPDL